MTYVQKQSAYGTLRASKFYTVISSFTRGNFFMVENSNSSDRSLHGILKSLSFTEEPHGAFYQTRSREDYETLLRAALSGEIKDEHLSVGRSGIYLNKFRVNPTAESFSN